MMGLNSRENYGIFSRKWTCWIKSILLKHCMFQFLEVMGLARFLLDISLVIGLKFQREYQFGSRIAIKLENNLK